MNMKIDFSPLRTATAKIGRQTRMTMFAGWVGLMVGPQVDCNKTPILYGIFSLFGHSTAIVYTVRVFHAFALSRVVQSASSEIKSRALD